MFAIRYDRKKEVAALEDEMAGQENLLERSAAHPEPGPVSQKVPRTVANVNHEMRKLLITN